MPVDPSPTLSPRPRAVADLDVNEADDGLVIYDPGRDRVHHLNPTAALVFLLCDGQHSPAQMAEELSEVFALGRSLAEETDQSLRIRAAQCAVE